MLSCCFFFSLSSRFFLGFALSLSFLFRFSSRFFLGTLSCCFFFCRYTLALCLSLSSLSLQFKSFCFAAFSCFFSFFCKTRFIFDFLLFDCFCICFLLFFPLLQDLFNLHLSAKQKFFFLLSHCLFFYIDLLYRITCRFHCLQRNIFFCNFFRLCFISFLCNFFRLRFISFLCNFFRLRFISFLCNFFRLRFVNVLCRFFRFCFISFLCNSLRLCFVNLLLHRFFGNFFRFCFVSFLCDFFRFCFISFLFFDRLFCRTLFRHVLFFALSILFVKCRFRSYSARSAIILLLLKRSQRFVFHL